MKAGRLPQATVVVLTLVLAVLLSCKPTTPPGAAEPSTPVVLVLVPDWQDAASSQRQLAELARSLSDAGTRWASVRLVMQGVSVQADEATKQIAAAIRNVKPEVLVAVTMSLAGTVQTVDQRLPIVFAGGEDPVATCLVDRIDRPGRNASGYTEYLPIEAKLVETLHDAFPATERVVVLVDGNVHPSSFRCSAHEVVGAARAQAVAGCRPGAVPDLAELSGAIDAVAFQQAAEQRRLSSQFVRVCTWTDVLDFAAHWRAEARATVVVPSRLLFVQRRREAAALFNEHRIPVVYEGLAHARAGGLLAIGPSRRPEPMTQVGELVMLILGGADVATIPVRMPGSVDVVVNVGAAEASGLLPSLAVLRRADELLP